MAVLEIIENYKCKGVVNFENILAVPSKDRLPGLVKVYGQQKIHAILVIMLSDFANSFNLIRPMTTGQIIAAALELITTSYEDNLAIEDFAIFFNGAKSAKYGKILDRMDQQTIFELFENYRENRHAAYLHAKREEDVKFKGCGPSDRISDSNDSEQNAIRKEMVKYYAKTVKTKHETGKTTAKDKQ